eukprot:CAMPEP_0197879722 /NCGR_PEP_ID=MMETSP1439-20131203/7739_1 /TAXON_ID=66791 /ORGANISM="Gonyaulax spinifera, Strain CCMP409" /LENGTH=207 /DNA_ID=CAMNT_0043499247 /DNA_START=67 /DNA_END=687 /DNA_ORIENTATION=+
MQCGSLCCGGDPATDSVRVDASAVHAAAMAEQLRAERDGETLAREEERLRLDEAQRQRLEEQEEQRAGEQRRRLEEEEEAAQRAAEEEAQSASEERTRRAAEETCLREQHGRKQALKSFCKQNGFTDISVHTVLDVINLPASLCCRAGQCANRGDVAQGGRQRRTEELLREDCRAHGAEARQERFTYERAAPPGQCGSVSFRWGVSQ